MKQSQIIEYICPNFNDCTVKAYVWIFRGDLPLQYIWSVTARLFVIVWENGVLSVVLKDMQVDP